MGGSEYGSIPLHTGTATSTLECGAWTGCADEGSRNTFLARSYERAVKCWFHIPQTGRPIYALTLLPSSESRKVYPC